MNRTGDLSLCRWTMLQYAMKADGDVGLAALFELLHITTQQVVSRMLISHERHLGKHVPIFYLHCVWNKYCGHGQVTPQPISILSYGLSCVWSPSIPMG